MGKLKQNIKGIFFNIYNIFSILLRTGNIKKVFSFSNFFKLLFIYVVSIIITIISEFNFSSHFWNKLINGNFSEKRIAFYSVRERIGESVLYDKVKKVAKEQGYDYIGLKAAESLSNFWLTKHFYYVSACLLNYLFKPQFNLALTHHVNIVPYGYNIAYLNMPRDSLYSPQGEFLKRWEHLNKYDAYADLYSFVHGENPILKAIVKDKEIIPLYLGHYTTEYNKIERKKAIITGTLWGCNRGSFRAKLAMKKLAEEDLLVAIGIHSHLSFIGKNYLGRMEDFGNILDCMEKQQKKYGIALIIHNQEHMLEGIPTSRISEAASNGALIISDRNVFLTEFFKDTVLYFDSFGTEEEIYRQIKAHIKWAQDNPELAEAKASEAYKIFQASLTIEKHLNYLFKRTSQF